MSHRLDRPPAKLETVQAVLASQWPPTNELKNLSKGFEGEGFMVLKEKNEDKIKIEEDTYKKGRHEDAMK